jgi:hypothetical protein
MGWPVIFLALWNDACDDRNDYMGGTTCKPDNADIVKLVVQFE